MKAFKHSVRGKRNENDFYPTHHSMVWQLMGKLHIPETYKIYDPACGNDDILKALKECGINNHMSGSDITKGDDFLTDSNLYDVIFTNPPFSIANIFPSKFSIFTRVLSSPVPSLSDCFKFLIDIAVSSLRLFSTPIFFPASSMISL